MKNDYSILIGGRAGQGSRTAGLIIAKLFSEIGYNIFIYDDYQSLVRGGHSFSHIRASEKEILSHREKIDFLLALDENTFKKHKKDLSEKGIVLYNEDEFLLKEKYAVGVHMDKIVEQFKGIPIMKNTALVAGFAKVLGLDWKTLETLFKKEFKKQQKKNLKIADQSFKRAEKITDVKKLKRKPFPLLTGNEALSLGAVKAGLDLYIAYPMTPASGILHYLAKNKGKFNIAVSQLENEVGIVNAAIGAAYAGSRTMVGTSGGGFALMTEGLSLAVQNETPLLIVESQRMSPGTGVPTYTGQGDLLFNLTAGHGDIVKFVVAPGDAQESFYWAGKTLNLSWKYQTPSILLIDKEVSESTFSFDEKVLNQVKYEKPLMWGKKGEYLRYKKTKKGISPLEFPGEKKAVVKSNSYEHDEFGITVEDEKLVKEMQEKRLRKFEEMKKEVEKLESVKIFGKKNSKKAIICWGSTKGPVKEVAEKLGIKMIFPVVLQPFPEKQMKKALEGVKKIALAETNGLSQLGEVLMRFGIKIDKKILKYDSRPFLPEEIEEKLSNF
jgi:2-oxoglutarate/2-oxoacid ferredoxin oxidoreductase subunit alpha